MTDQGKKTLAFWYGLFLSLFTAVLGVLYITGAADIYFSGAGTDTVYSREIVGQKLFVLMVPTLLYIVAVIAGAVLTVVFPVQKKRKAAIAPESTLKKLKRKIPQSAIGTEEYAAYEKGEKTRLIARGVVFAYLLAAAITCLVYLCNTANFPNNDLNGEILQMLARVLPFSLSGLLLVCALAVFERFFIKRELENVKATIKKGGGAPVPPSVFSQRLNEVQAKVFSFRGLLAIRVAVAVIGVVLLFTGIFNGGAADVLTKAVNICTECIGLG